MQISVVIPTFNRPDRLVNVLMHIFASDCSGFEDIEVVVVDDGSSNSPKSVVDSFNPKTPFSLKYIYQDNSGPAKARNNGYRCSSNEIVLFIDDDILVPPTLLRKHILSHQNFPKSVIVGPCVCFIPKEANLASLYVKSLEEADLAAIPASGVMRITTVISGNLSIERSQFLSTNGLYNDSLRSPTAEEFDVIARLIDERIPTYLIRDLEAIHLQPTDLADTCIREYKHAIGIGELFVKDPMIANRLEGMRNFFEVNGNIERRDSIVIKVKKSVKRLLSPKLFRAVICQAVSVFSYLVPVSVIVYPLFRFVIGLYIYAGVQDGRSRFSSEATSHLTLN